MNTVMVRMHMRHECTFTHTQQLNKNKFTFLIALKEICHDEYWLAIVQWQCHAHAQVQFWQYNEIWPTGGWGSIEYGTPVQGQVVGGRWKPLQHFLRRSVYATVGCRYTWWTYIYIYIYIHS